MEQEISGEGRTLSMALVRAFQGDREGAFAELEGLSMAAGGGALLLYLLFGIIL